MPFVLRGCLIGPVLLVGRANHLCRDRASQLNSLSKFVFVYMRGGQPSLARSRYWLPRSRLGGLEIVHFPPGRASKSKLHRHDKGWLDQHFLDNFNFTSSVCLYVGYKIKTCTQISDSGFRGKINVVFAGDSAKRASLVRRASFSQVNARWNAALLLGLVLPKGLAFLHVNTPLLFS